MLRFYQSIGFSLKEIKQFESRIDVRQVGRVLEVGDGIAQVYGLSDVMAGEMLEFDCGVTGLAFNLEENSVGVIILGDLACLYYVSELIGLIQF